MSMVCSWGDKGLAGMGNGKAESQLVAAFACWLPSVCEMSVPLSVAAAGEGFGPEGVVLV